VGWAQRFLAAPPEALAAAKAVIDGTFEKGKGARSKSIADERRRYVEVFAASQANTDA
jgi:hypothetical protein